VPRPTTCGKTRTLRRRPVKVQLALRNHVALWDCAFLAGIVSVSFACYVVELGFRGDDWEFLRLFSTSPSQSITDLFASLYSGDPRTAQRPVQILAYAIQWKLFGLNPVGYHLTNSLVLVVVGVLLYLVLRELRQPRAVALAVPAIYVLMPNYATDRFWPAAAAIPLSIALYLLSLYGDLRAVGEHGLIRRWKAASLGALLLSGLAYELTMPLFLISAALMIYRARQIYGPQGGSTFVRKHAAILFLSSVLVLLAVATFKLAVSVRLGVEGTYLEHLTTLVTGALRVNYGVYGVGLPYVMGWILLNRAEVLVLSIGAVTGTAVAAYIFCATRHSSDRASQRYWLVLSVGGLAVFALGYAIFLGQRSGGSLWFTSTSIGNRINMAAAVGVALTFVALVGWVASFPRSQSLRTGTFSVGIGTVCACGVIVVNTLASFWAEAHTRQEEILADIRMQLPDLDSGSAVLLNGVCFERGGAHIFGGDLDFQAALRILYSDGTLSAATIMQTPRAEERTLVVGQSGKSRSFRYGSKLLLYDGVERAVVPLVDASVARQYFRRSGFSPEHDCEQGFAWGLN
jgi:hypothetical protein